MAFAGNGAVAGGLGRLASVSTVETREAGIRGADFSNLEVVLRLAHSPYWSRRAWSARVVVAERTHRQLPLRLPP